MDALAEVVISHQERAVVRVGDVFLKCDVSTERLERELIALRTAEVPTPEVLWERSGPPRIVALSQVPGEPLRPTDADDRWSRTGEAARRLHGQPAPTGLPGPMQLADIAAWIDTELRYVVDHDRLPRPVMDRAEASARTLLDINGPAAFCHGDLQPDHVFFVDAGLTGIIDWADARIGDPSYDLAVLTSTAKDKLAAVATGYGSVDEDRVRAWWSLRHLGEIRWNETHGFSSERSQRLLIETHC